MAKSKWIVDGHHYTCPNCKKTIAIVVNESDENIEFCPFCGKRMSDQRTESNFEKLLGKNGELAEERKGQVLAGALGIVRRHCKETPNKIEVIAQLFGKKPNEEFEIVTPSGKVRKVKFTTDRGLLYYDRIGNEWNKNFGFLNFLCEGKAVIDENND